MSPLHYAFTFPIEITRWQEAAQLLVNRHAALRTSFPVIDNVPMQKIAGYEPVDFTALDVALVGSSAVDRRANGA